MLGTTSRPRKERSGSQVSDTLEAWFSASESGGNPSSSTAEKAPSGDPDSSSVDLDESSGFLKVKELFDSPVGKGDTAAGDSIPTARLVSKSKPKPKVNVSSTPSECLPNTSASQGSSFCLLRDSRHTHLGCIFGLAYGVALETEVFQGL